MIYTASFFQPENHHGQIISIARSRPKHVKIDGVWEFFAPSKELLASYKKKPDQLDYYYRYRDELIPKLDVIKATLAAIDPAEDMTLCCWEKAGEFCHRNLVAKVFLKWRPEIFAGCDIPNPTR